MRFVVVFVTLFLHRLVNIVSREKLKHVKQKYEDERRKKMNNKNVNATFFFIFNSFSAIVFVRLSILCVAQPLKI